MRGGALCTHTVAIALAAISFAGSAGAGIVLCGDVTHHASVQTHCDDGGSKKNKARIDELFGADAPGPAWVFLDDWKSAEAKLKSRGPKREEHRFHHGHLLDPSLSWSFGVFGHDGKWAQARPHDRTPSRNIPEPGSLALFAIGLVGAALSRRYKRN